MSAVPPLGVFRRAGEPPRVGARLEAGVADLAALARVGELAGVPADVLEAGSLNELMALGRDAWDAVVAAARGLAGDPERAAGVLVAHDAAEALLPIAVADYVDFSSSIHHAANVGRMFRPGEDPLPPAWRHLPIGYHGRAGTVVVSGTPVRRPRGQRPSFGPSERLDVELELGYVIGTPSVHGEPVPVAGALEHVFGVVLLNDWSARDLQAWEYRPLGPFLAKSFATSISAWVLPLEALEDARVPGEGTGADLAAYLREEPWAYDVELELELCGEVVSRTNARHLAWSVAQQVAHLTSNGASLRTGDLLGTGTISGPDPGTEGCLLELTRNGARPLRLAGGAERTFLADGDEVVLRGRAGASRLGEVRGRIAPA